MLRFGTLDVVKPSKGWEFNFLSAISTVEQNVLDAKISFPVFCWALDRNYSSHQFATYSKFVKYSSAKSFDIELRVIVQIYLSCKKKTTLDMYIHSHPSCLDPGNLFAQMNAYLKLSECVLRADHI